MSYCPYSNGECKKSVCRFWSKLENDCLVALQLEDDSIFRVELKEADKIGLVKVGKELEKVLNKSMIYNLIKSSAVSDTDKVLVKTLYNQIEKKEEELDLGRLWS